MARVMSELNPELAGSVLEMCRDGAGETADALTRALDGKFALSVGEATTFGASGAAAELDGPGLAIAFHVGPLALAAVLSESTGLLPAWYKTPDATGTSKLATLAQELGMLVLPEALSVGETKTSYVANLKAALAAAGLSDDATHLALQLTSGEKSGVLRLIWPLTAPAQLLAAPAVAPASVAPSASPPATESKPTPKPVVPPKPTASTMRAAVSHPADFSGLPGYSRSLLKISVPVSVELASKKETLQEVIALAPGSIIKFDKGCEEMLRLLVGENAVAVGEAVKVGEKFGFRVTSMLLPPEHFVSAKQARSA
jgi:flagellar motor switch protein FliN/FliY